MENDFNVLHALRQYRHDWLNKIQLIKGYIDLGRMEKVQQLIEEVIQEAKNESDLTNLNMKRVATKLLTFNWENHPYVLTYEVIRSDKPYNWQEKESLINELLEEHFTCLDHFALRGEENELYLVFKEIPNIELEIDFHGQVINKEKFMDKLMQIRSTHSNIIKNVECSSNGYYIAYSFSK